MGLAYILAKGDEATHTYSRNKLEKLKAEGWKHIYSVSGWNLSLSAK